MEKTSKICGFCKTEKPLSDFYRLKKDSEYFQTNCKDCCREIHIRRIKFSDYDPSLPGEIWKDVVGFENVYKVSDKGRIRRVGMAAGASPGKILKPKLHKTRSYYRVSLYNQSFNTDKDIHILVAEAFIGIREYELVINHKDGNKLNNCVENLEYVSFKENCEHAARTGLTAKGERHGHSRLKEQQIKEIRELADKGVSQYEIARRFNTRQGWVSRIVNRKVWTHLD